MANGRQGWLKGRLGRWRRRARSPHVAPGRRWKAVFRCAACRRVEGVVELQVTLRPSGGASSVALYLDSGLASRNQAWLERVPERLAELQRAVAGRSARDLHAWGADWAPFYCAACGTCYCERHWSVRRIGHADSERGEFYDSMECVCPAGHSRIVYG